MTQNNLLTQHPYTELQKLYVAQKQSQKELKRLRAIEVAFDHERKGLDMAETILELIESNNILKEQIAHLQSRMKYDKE